jgi:hypothetical protein
MYKRIIDQVKPILSKHGVNKAALFGSVARGDFNEGSDVDLLVELGEEMSLFDFIGLKQELEDQLQTKVDLVQYKTIKPSLKKYILKDERVFYQK